MLARFSNFSIPFKASISKQDVDSISDSEQYFHDCYLISSLESLSDSTNGQKILQKNIEYDDENPDVINCYLHTNNGVEKYSVPQSEAIKGYEKVYEHQDNKIVRSVNISVNEYEKKHSSKPFFCKMASMFKNYSFEYSLASHFMTMMTGVKPTVNIAETSLNVNLESHREEVMKLFERMQEEKDHSLVIGCGVKKVGGKRFHALVLKDVDLENNVVTVKNKRGNQVEQMSVDEALSTFKYIVGYFNSDLEQAAKS